MEYWYRYDDACYAAPIDEFGDRFGNSAVYVKLTKYPVIKHTAKGVWLSLIYFNKDYYNSVSDYIFRMNEKRFVLLNARKKFACPTIELAKESFIARKNRQISIHSAHVRTAELAKKIVLRNNGEYITKEDYMDHFK